MFGVQIICYRHVYWKIDGMEWENCGDVEDGVLVQVVVAEEMVKKSYEKDSSLDWELTKLFGGEVGGGGGGGSRCGGVGGGVLVVLANGNSYVEGDSSLIWEIELYAGK